MLDTKVLISAAPYEAILDIEAFHHCLALPGQGLHLVRWGTSSSLSSPAYNDLLEGFLYFVDGHGVPRGDIENLLDFGHTHACWHSIIPVLFPLGISINYQDQHSYRPLWLIDPKTANLTSTQWYNLHGSFNILGENSSQQNSNAWRRAAKVLWVNKLLVEWVRVWTLLN